jgi:hypothetical protein
LDKLLLVFGLKRAAVDGQKDKREERKKRTLDFWLDQVAIFHARFIARCVLNRAAACVDAVNASYARASIVDVTSAMSKPLPRSPPQPLPPPPPGNASAAAFAPAAKGPTSLVYR